MTLSWNFWTNYALKITQQFHIFQEKWQDILTAYQELELSFGMTLEDPILTEDMLKDLLKLDSKNGYLKTLTFFQKRYQVKLIGYIKKRARQRLNPIMAEKHRESIAQNDHISYGLGHNTIFLRVNESTVDNLANYRYARDMVSSDTHQPIVIDCSWTKNATSQQNKSLFFKELPYLFNYNRHSYQPFDIHVTSCDFRKNERLIKKQFPKHLEAPQEVLETFTEKSHLDLFDKDRLVYLSPDSRNDLKYHADDIYIIGGLIDTDIMSNASLSVAKRQGIRHARLPMKKVRGLHGVLTLETVLGILVDYRITKDWFYAMRWLPPRIFRNRLKAHAFTAREEHVYFAQKELFPNNYYTDNAMMNNIVYRKKFLDILKMAPKSDKLIDPEKYKVSEARKISTRRKMYGDEFDTDMG